MDKEKAWTKILEFIKNQTTAGNFRTWFSQTTLKQIDEEKIIISVPSAFIKDQLLLRYQKMIEESLDKILGKNLKIDFEIDPSIVIKNKSFKNADTYKESREEDFFLLPQAQNLHQINLNPKYNLKNFVVGPTNNLAYAAAQAIVQNPGSSYNPLFIYGPSGVGKTHLMQAIGNALISKNSYFKLIYASSERFMNDFVESIQNKKTGDFRQKYRSADVFLIDDVQFLAGKDSTQEEFFHTFNDLQTRNTQIILTSDRQPNDLQKLESRLVSRFQGGLMVDIQLPDLETRMAILKAKLIEKGESMDEDILRIIAESTDSNTRELEGRLTQILQISKLSNDPITAESIRTLLGKNIKAHNSVLDHKKILSGINQYFNLRLADLIGPRRQKELVLPRQIAMFLMYEESKLPMEKIGQILGGRDHTTVLHGIEKIKEAIGRDREIQRLVVELRQQLLN